MMFSHVLIHPYIFLVTPTRKLVTIKKRALKHAPELHIRAMTWSTTIVDEVQYISLIIDAEIYHAINQGEMSLTYCTSSTIAIDHVAAQRCNSEAFLRAFFLIVTSFLVGVTKNI